MKILWFPRLQFDVDRLHLVTWREMSRELEKRGHAVRVVVAGVPAAESPEGWIRLPLVRVKGLRLLGFWLAGCVVFAWQYLTFRPELVILDVYTAGFGLPFAWARRRAAFLVDNRFPIAHTSIRRGAVRGMLERWLTSVAFSLARRRYDGMTVITNFFRDLVAQRYGFPAWRIGVWGSGVDPELFDPARYEPSVQVGGFNVFQHGELSFNRGILETVRSLREAGMENVVLTLLGDGPARQEIERVSFECGVDARVRILAPVPVKDVPAHLAASDCVALAYPVDEYWNCNHPVKFVEALAMGKVVVCTPLSVALETGFSARCLEMIPDNRPATIAQAILRCMRDPSLPDRGKAGIDVARRDYTWGRQAERLLAFVESARKERPGP